MVTIPKSGIITAVYVMIILMQNSHLHPSPLSMRSIMRCVMMTNESNAIFSMIIDISDINSCGGYYLFARHSLCITPAVICYSRAAVSFIEIPETVGRLQ